jgi:hypothetical protein
MGTRLRRAFWVWYVATYHGNSTTIFSLSFSLVFSALLVLPHSDAH